MSAVVAAEPAIAFSGDTNRFDRCPSTTDRMDHHPKLEKSLSKETEATKAAQMAKYNALKEKKQKLEEELRKKVELLYDTCLKEAELTGSLPLDTPFLPGKPVPVIRKRVGTGFTLSSKFLSPDKQQPDKISALEQQFEIQQKQMEAMLKLSQDKSSARSIRRKYRQQYRDAHLQLKELEEKLNKYRRRAGRSLINIPDTVEEFSEDSQEFLDDPSSSAMDPDDIMSPQADGQGNSDTCSLASQQSTKSDSHARNLKIMNRSRSSTPLTNLSGSLSKMEIKDFDKPSSLRSNARSASSGSLKEQIQSSDISSPAQIKIYRKMVYHSVHSPQINPSYPGFQIVNPKTFALSSGGDYATSRPSSSVMGRQQQRRQMRSCSSTLLPRHTQSPSLSEHSDVSERRRPQHASCVDVVRRGSSKISMTSSESGNFSIGDSSSPSTPLVENAPDITHIGSEVNVADKKTSSEEAYEEQTRTWPRKRGSRHLKRNQSDSETKAPPDPDPVLDMADSLADVDSAAGNLNDSLDLAGLGPLEFCRGNKREPAAVNNHNSSLYEVLGPRGHFLQSVHSYSSDPNVRNVADDIINGHSEYRSSHLSAHHKHNQHRQQHRIEMKDKAPLEWVKVPEPVVCDSAVTSSSRTEEILLSQGHRQTSFSPATPSGPVLEYSPKYRNTQPPNTMLDDSAYFSPNVSPAKASYGGCYPPPLSSTSSSLLYSNGPSVVAGHSYLTLGSRSATMDAGRNAVDLLFDNLFKASDTTTSSSSTSLSYAGMSSPYTMRRATPQPASHWPDPSPHPLTASHRVKHRVRSSNANVPSRSQTLPAGGGGGGDKPPSQLASRIMRSLSSPSEDSVNYHNPRTLPPSSSTVQPGSRKATPRSLSARRVARRAPSATTFNDRCLETMPPMQTTARETSQKSSTVTHNVSRAMTSLTQCIYGQPASAPVMTSSAQRRTRVGSTSLTELKSSTFV